MERMRTILFLFAIGVASMVVVSPGGAADVPQDPVATPELAAAGEPSCPCACSPLAGAWIAKLSSPVATSIDTFKFLPVDTACTRFAVNAQITVRDAKVLKAWPDANEITEFVGTACRTEKKKVEFTAIGYGVEKRFDCRCNDKVAFIAIMSGCVEVPEKCEKCEQACQDAECGCSATVCTCEEPKELEMTLNVAYFDACQDEDRDGFPDACNAVICISHKTKIKRVELMPPCEPGESFIARLSACEDCSSQATGRAFFKLEDDDKKVSFVICVACIKDVTKAEIFISAEEGEQGTPAVQLFPTDTVKEKSAEICGLLACGTFSASDFFGPLKNKKIADLVKAIEEERATVVITTKKFPKGEICGPIEDP
jgi:hypothetical protein